MYRELERVAKVFSDRVEYFSLMDRSMVDNRELELQLTTVIRQAARCGLRVSVDDESMSGGTATSGTSAGGGSPNGGAIAMGGGTRTLDDAFNDLASTCEQSVVVASQAATVGQGYAGGGGGGGATTDDGAIGVRVATAVATVQWAADGGAVAGAPYVPPAITREMLDPNAFWSAFQPSDVAQPTGAFAHHQPPAVYSNDGYQQQPPAYDQQHQGYWQPCAAYQQQQQQQQAPANMWHASTAVEVHSSTVDGAQFQWQHQQQSAVAALVTPAQAAVISAMTPVEREAAMEATIAEVVATVMKKKREEDELTRRTTAFLKRPETAAMLVKAMMETEEADS